MNGNRKRGRPVKELSREDRVAMEFYGFDPGNAEDREKYRVFVRDLIRGHEKRLTTRWRRQKSDLENQMLRIGVQKLVKENGCSVEEACKAVAKQPPDSEDPRTTSRRVRRRIEKREDKNNRPVIFRDRYCHRP
jgi:hypothetical protein